MSGFSSFFGSRLLNSMNTAVSGARGTGVGNGSSERSSNSDGPLGRLRYSFETLPGARNNTFNAAARAQMLTELYDAFWGPHADLFLPTTSSPSAGLSSETQAAPTLPPHITLAEHQRRVNFCGAAEPEPTIPGRPCGHIFNKGESCFRCKDCALDDSCVMCTRCFHATSHVGHNVSFFIAQQSGGSCDCGDFEAWRSPIKCPFHPEPDDESMSDATSGSTFSPAQVQTTPRAVPRTLWGQDIPPVKDYPFRAEVPAELWESMTRTITYAFDFLLDTLDLSPDDTGVPDKEADVRLQPTADAMSKEEWCMVVWNDDKHSFEEVIRLTTESTQHTREDASAIAYTIDDTGRAVVETSTDLRKLLEVAHTFGQVDLGVTVRRAFDTFREQMACVIIEWLLDLTRARVGMDTLMLREIMANELLTSRRKDASTISSLHQISKVIPDDPDAARLDWMFMYHTKLWKKPRLNLKEIYASVLSLSQEHKLAVAIRFANTYHRIIDAYLLVDREAETSIKYFALQLFTVPSVALHIVREHRIVSRLLSIITAFFTSQITDKRIAYPPNEHAEVNVESTPFKSKRFMPVFSDLRYLCHNAPVQRLIARDPHYLERFAHTCQLFMCVNPNKRAATNHVEYETDAWISVFNVTLSLSRVIKVYGEAFTHASVAELVAGITTVVRHTLMVCTLSTERLDRSKFAPVEFYKVPFGGRLYEVVLFDVLEGWVSFHHSLHWLLAELLKHTNLLTSESLAQAGLSSLRDVMLRNASERAMQTLFDFPLRVLAMIAQIRTGLWVRNGFAIRGQLLHYRDFMLRELCYDQDLFMLQTAFVVLDPDHVLVTILDRFQLTAYFSGETEHPAYDSVQLYTMVEELFYVLITLLSEHANAGHIPLTAAIRREIVHALAVGPCTFTDLVKRVAERMVDDVCFERVLKEVAHFRAPDSTADVGMYELKDEAFAEVNPFFYHYTRNKREEVEQILRSRLKKKHGIEDPLIIPTPLGITFGPFATLHLAFESEVLLQIMFYAVYNAVESADANGNMPPSSEAILDQVLHLIMLAVIERPQQFSQLCIFKSFGPQADKTLLDLLCSLEHHEKFKTYRARIAWIIDQLAREVPEEVQTRRKTLDSVASKKVDSEEARKKAAKARQEAIMKQMKQQQDSFASLNFEDEEDEEDIDEDMGAEHEEPESYGTCIVCQEELNAGSRSFGLLALLQPSKFLKRYPVGQAHASPHFTEVLEMPSSLDRAAQIKKNTAFPPPEAEKSGAVPAFSAEADGFPPASTRFGLHASICSHLMHLDCFQMYSVSTRQRHRTQAARNHPENLARKEFICPLCKSLGNIILPISLPSRVPLSVMSFSDWIRASGISILKSKPDTHMESLQFKNGTGEFAFWSVQDPGYVSYHRDPDRWKDMEMHKIVDTLVITAKMYSQQTRHLRDRPEPDPGERGHGIYLPEEVVGYTIACIEAAHRGTGGDDCLVADNLTESQVSTVRGLIICLSRLAASQFRSRPDEGRESVRQAIIKRLLPEWSRTSHTAFSFPLLLREPLTLLVEASAVDPEILPHILTLTYYACLARAAIGIVNVLHKNRTGMTIRPSEAEHTALFGDVRIFFMSVVRHSPLFESMAGAVLKTYGESTVERLLYAFTLPFLRQALILCRSIMPGAAFATPTSYEGAAGNSEYARLLFALRIPPLAELPTQDALQTALSGWCAHYGQMHAAAQLNTNTVIALDHPVPYAITRLPTVLDDLFDERGLVCQRCRTTPLDAAICLICGTVCCMQSHCCNDHEYERGECNMHTRDCGGAIGVFFLVKRCALLYLYGGNGTFAASPYLDVHGEVDQSMRRGRRQYLHPARWDEVRKIWLNHGVPTLVARKLESTVDSGGWETL